MGITVYSDKNKALKALYKGFADNYNKGVKRTEIFCDEAIVLSVYKDIEKNAFDNLKKYGCIPKSIWYGYVGNTVYIEY